MPQGMVMGSRLLPGGRIESSVSLGSDSLDPLPSLPRLFNMSNKMMQNC